MISKNLANTLYWQAEKFRGRIGIKERLEWLMKTQEMSAEEIKKIQLTKLNHLLHHAYLTVPYYQRVFKERNLCPDDINNQADLQKLPLLTREILLKHQDELVSSKADFSTIKNNYSSGSTGRRALFKQDENFRLWMRAHQIRTYQWCSQWELGERFVLLWGSEIYWNLQSIKDKLINFLSNRREFNTFKLSSRLIKNFTNSLLNFNPILISSYANALHLISLEVKRRGLRIPALRAIQTTSEPMPPAIRNRVQEVFNCEVFDKYGSRETNIVSHESPAHDGLLIQSENVVAEFLNQNLTACLPHEKGKIVLTTLNNFSMPLVRYETSDIAAPISGYSKESFQFSRMTEVSGREQDLIYTPNNDYIDSYFFSYLFMRFESIHWFQVTQEQYDHLRIVILAPNGINLETKNEIVDRITAHTGYKFKVDFEILSEMPESSTGKFRLCVSKVKESRNVAQAIVEDVHVTV
ncbi:MAG: hypothetical protein A3E87_05465 [Gammaproteobacteria bacterium RIFCSPHIGHO2_12_FULL_35_23]|nr:MAG: hypothetical protein A3E87_05465 [Gammaproteobacteria bacterium RIFCSPHIGHO2_12_FULL_35_23]